MGPEIHEILAWRDRLRRRAEIWGARAGHGPASPAFAPMSVEPWFRAWRGGAVPAPPRSDSAPDVRLWWALVEPTAPVPDQLASPDRSPIAPRDSYRTIEAWTEADLASIHALWWLGRKRARAEWVSRSLDAAAWHTEHIQPDNATNRPWAIHVFLDLWRTRSLIEGRLHAETMLHNADAGAGTAATGPGRLIADIAADAANALDEMLAS